MIKGQWDRFSGATKRGLLIGLIVVLFMGLWSLRTEPELAAQRTRFPTSQATVAVRSTNNAKCPKVAAAERTLQKRAAGIRQMMDRRRADAMMPLPAIPTRIDGDSRVINVTLQAQAVCFRGDGDILLSDMAHGANREVLLTVEPMSEGPIAVQRIPPRALAQLAKGYETSFSVKNPKVTKHFGVFLCTAPAGEGRCSGGRLDDVGRLAKALEERRPLTPSPRGRIYLFHHLLLTPTQTFLNSVPVDRREKATLAAYSTRFGAGPSTVAELKAAENLLLTASSLPGEINRQGVVFKVPFYQAACRDKLVKAQPALAEAIEAARKRRGH